MLQTAAIIVCERCEAATARFERGWCAYVTTDGDAETRVTFVCPACAERSFGEDEAAWSGSSTARAAFCSWPELRAQRSTRSAGSATALLCAYLPIVAFAFWAAPHLLNATLA